MIRFSWGAVAGLALGVLLAAVLGRLDSPPTTAPAPIDATSVSASARLSAASSTTPSLDKTTDNQTRPTRSELDQDSQSDSEPDRDSTTRREYRFLYVLPELAVVAPSQQVALLQDLAARRLNPRQHAIETSLEGRLLTLSVYATPFDDGAARASLPTQIATLLDQWRTLLRDISDAASSQVIDTTESDPQPSSTTTPALPALVVGYADGETLQSWFNIED